MDVAGMQVELLAQVLKMAGEMQCEISLVGLLLIRSRRNEAKEVVLRTNSASESCVRLVEMK
jgi:hypothetical protein